MKLADLRKKAYRIAGVSTTPQLKAQYSEIKPLDMRYKVSWEKALSILKPAKPEQEPSSDFEDWLSSPPDEFKALFAEAESALGAFDDKLKKAKQLTKTTKAMANSLDEFAEAGVAEAQKLVSQAKQTDSISKQANLN